MEWPILYKRTSSGAVLQWAIETEGATIVRHHGHVGGSIQSGRDTLRAGKNLGRSNATTPEEQAQAEAAARWLKQKKRGYVESFDDAEAGRVDTTVIEGGIAPMLAPNKSYPKDAAPFHKAIVYPCAFQPKLDGMRCEAVIEDGLCTLWSRTQKPIVTVPHVVEAYERAFGHLPGRIVVDGELYNHEYAAEFEELISLLRGDEPDDEGRYLKAEHHVYDLPYVDPTAAAELSCDAVSAASPFSHRKTMLAAIMIGTHATAEGSPLRLVPTNTAANLEELLALYEAALQAGYEGGMARNLAAPYESGKRSKHLQKMKEFIDHEFEIVDAEEGRGKAAGHVGAFVCRTAPGTYPEGEAGAPAAGAEPQEFNVTPKMTYARRKALWERPELWRGKWLTVRFKRWTVHKKPYIPSGRAIRDYE